jgi:hypothetical protein
MRILDPSLTFDDVQKLLHNFRSCLATRFVTVRLTSPDFSVIPHHKVTLVRKMSFEQQMPA